MWGSVGGFLFDTLVTFIFLFAELAHLLVSRLGQLLAAAFYIFGPLALVFSIPTFSRVGHAWFKRYITYCCWPLFSAILLKLVLALLVGAKLPSAAAMMILSALCVPHIAAELIGGSAANFMALGAAKAVAAARSMGHAVTGAMKAKDTVADAAGAVKDKAAAAGAVVANAAVAPVANPAGLMQAMARSEIPAHLKDVTAHDRPAGGARSAGGGAAGSGAGGAVANSPPAPAAPGHADTAGGRPKHQGNTTLKGRGEGAVALPSNAPGEERPPKPPPEAFEGHEDVTR
jgi:hypothetical protein